MSDEIDLTTFRKKLEERRAKLAKQLADRPPPEDVPDIAVDETSSELDHVISTIGITDAYNKWCGKSTPKGRGKEGVKVSCPVPEHPDANPSAWLNTDKNVWYCGACDLGGDAYDIAAYHYGLENYKTDGTSFKQLRRHMAEDFGYTIVEGVEKTYAVAVEEDEPIPQPTLEVNHEPVIVLTDESPIEIDFVPFTIDWRNLVEPDTFLWEYLQTVTKDDSPEEYHFWESLVALAFALGKQTRLFDSPLVAGNLFICLLGQTGIGKSKSKRYMVETIRAALPYDFNDPFSTGTKIVGSTGSGEYLIKAFSAQVVDPADPKNLIGFAPVRGYADYDEFSSLVSKTSRVGSTLKPTMMEMYDGAIEVASGSMTHGNVKAEHPFCQVISTTQNSSVRDLVTRSDADSGFLNRWIFVTGKPKKQFSINTTVIDLANSVKKLQEIKGWSSSVTIIQWSDAALKKWDEFFHSAVVPQKGVASQDDSLLGRVDLILKKLILLFTANQKLKEVPEDAVDKAIALWPYLLASYGALRTELHKTESGELRDRILQKIRDLTDKLPDPPTKKQIYDSVGRRKFSDKQIVDTLAILVKLGLVIEIQSRSGAVGRPTIRYKVVD